MRACRACVRACVCVCVLAVEVYVPTRVGPTVDCRGVTQPVLPTVHECVRIHVP